MPGTNIKYHSKTILLSPNTFLPLTITHGTMEVCSKICGKLIYEVTGDWGSLEGAPGQDGHQGDECCLEDVVVQQCHS